MGEFLILLVLGLVIVWAVKKHKQSNTATPDRIKDASRMKMIRVVGGVIILILAASVFLAYSTQKSDTKKSSPLPKSEDPVKLTKWNWTKSGFGNVMMLSGKIVNSADYPVKDINIACGLDGNSGTHLGSADQTIYETVSPGKTLSIKGFNMGFIHSQATKANCEVIYYEKVRK